MTAFASADDLATYLGRSFTDAEIAQALMMLDFASGVIRREAAQTISLVDDDEVSLRGTWSPNLRLPERPVVDVISVVVGDDPPLAAVDYHLVGDTLVRGWWDGVVVNRSEDAGSGHWGGDRKVTVTYTHGFAEIPPEIIGLCLSIAARGLGTIDGAGISQETTGSYSVSYAGPAGSLALTVDERDALHRWMRQQQA